MSWCSIECSLPATAKIPGGQLKALLMPLARRLLPREVWDRSKQGFSSPLDAWMAGRWRSAVEATLDWGEANIPLFDYAYLRRLHALNIADGGTAESSGTRLYFSRGRRHIDANSELS